MPVDAIKNHLDNGRQSPTQQQWVHRPTGGNCEGVDQRGERVEVKQCREGEEDEYEGDAGDIWMEWGRCHVVRKSDEILWRIFIFSIQVHRQDLAGI